jgi:hypothetical protein
LRASTAVIPLASTVVTFVFLVKAMAGHCKFRALIEELRQFIDVGFP